MQFILSGNFSICIGWYLPPSSGEQTTVSTASGIYHTVTAICRFVWSWRFALNRPVTLPENQALFHSLCNLLLTNNHVVSNSELQYKKFSYRVAIEVVANGIHHKMYANTSRDPPFAPSAINFNILCYECTNR
jgi:hypothetical protein